MSITKKFLLIWSVLFLGVVYVNKYYDAQLQALDSSKTRTFTIYDGSGKILNSTTIPNRGRIKTNNPSLCDISWGCTPQVHNFWSETNVEEHKVSANGK